LFERCISYYYYYYYYYYYHYHHHYYYYNYHYNYYYYHHLVAQELWVGVEHLLEVKGANIEEETDIDLAMGSRDDAHSSIYALIVVRMDERERSREEVR